MEVEIDRIFLQHSPNDSSGMIYSFKPIPSISFSANGGSLTDSDMRTTLKIICPDDFRWGDKEAYLYADRQPSMIFVEAREAVALARLNLLGFSFVEGSGEDFHEGWTFEPG